MSILKNNLPAPTAEILDRSADFAARIQDYLPSILCDVGHYSNEAFLLRSYVSLRSDNQGDELAMTVDIRNESASDTSTTILIESELCLDDGTIVATGPSAKFENSSSGFEKAISSWSKEFEAFLNASEVNAVNVLRELISKNNKVSPLPGKF